MYDANAEFQWYAGRHKAFTDRLPRPFRLIQGNRRGTQCIVGGTEDVVVEFRELGTWFQIGEEPAVEDSEAVLAAFLKRVALPVQPRRNRVRSYI